MRGRIIWQRSRPAPIGTGLSQTAFLAPAVYPQDRPSNYDGLASNTLAQMSVRCLSSG